MTEQDDLVKLLARHVLGHVTPEHCTADCMATAILAAGWVPPEVCTDLRSRLACVLEATCWDRPYDVRIAAIRGMCDLTTSGLTPATDCDQTAADLRRHVAAQAEVIERVRAALVHTDPSQIIGHSRMAWLDGEAAMAHRVRAALAAAEEA